MTAARPGIHTIGTVHDDGHTVTVSGWGLSICAAQCRCHEHPTTGQLGIMGSHDGRLGLVKWRACDCCEPWTVDELVAVLRDLADVHALVEQ